MATITKRNKSYLIRVSCGYDTNGQQIIKSKTWKPSENLTPKQIEKELNRVVVEFEKNVQNGNTAETTNIRLKDFCVQYYELSKNTLAPSTQAAYKRVINNFIIPALGHMKLKDIKPIHVQQFIQMISEEGITEENRSLSPASVQRYFIVLKSIMAKAYKLGLTDINPTDTSRLDLPKIEEPEIDIFTKEEAAHMLSCLDSEPLMYQLLIHLAIVTGCRRGELVALKWDCIDYNRKTVVVKQSNYKLKGEEIKTKQPKTQRSIREITIPDYLIEMLNKYYIEQVKEQIRLGDRWHNENWIFTQWDGKPMYPTTPTHWFVKFQQRHYIPHHKFHSLRHSSATLLLTDGTNIKTVASRLGHTQLSTTNRYLHNITEADTAAAESFQNLIIPDKNTEKERKKS